MSPRRWRSSGLRHVVITSVDRDDLADGGAEHFARVIGAIRARSPGHDHRSADAGFPAQAGRDRNRDGGAARRVQPQSRNRAAALSDDPARARAISRRCACSSGPRSSIPDDLHQIGPDGRAGREPRRDHAGDGRSARRRRRFPHHRPISAADAEACGARPLRDAGGIRGLCLDRARERVS